MNVNVEYEYYVLYILYIIVFIQIMLNDCSEDNGDCDDVIVIFRAIYQYKLQ